MGTDASETTPLMRLAGDRNLIGQENKSCPAAEINSGITHLELDDAPLPQWDKEVHHGAGNLALADGSVRQLPQSGLLSQMGQQGNADPNHDNCILKPRPPH